MKAEDKRIMRDAVAGIEALRLHIARLTRKPRILLVEDNPEDRFMLISTINEILPSEIIEAPSGEAAVTVMAQQDVDIIFLDLMLPGMGGEAFMRQLSEDERRRLIIFTGLDNRAEQIKECIRLGAIKVITKPAKVEDLKALFGQKL